MGMAGEGEKFYAKMELTQIYIYIYIDVRMFVGICFQNVCLKCVHHEGQVGAYDVFEKTIIENVDRWR